MGNKCFQDTFNKCQMLQVPVAAVLAVRVRLMTECV